MWRLGIWLWPFGPGGVTSLIPPLSAFMYEKMVYGLSTTGLRLVYDRSTTGLRLVYDWSATGPRLV